MADEPDLLSEELEALDRIARSHDGILFHRFLRRQLEYCLDMGDSGALRSLNGRRSLARDLMRHMAQGIEAQTRGSADATIIPAGKPAGVRSPRAALKRQFDAAFDDEQREFDAAFTYAEPTNTGGV